VGDLSRVEPPEVADRLFAAFVAGEAERRALLTDVAGGSVTLDGTLESLTRLGVWFEDWIDGGLLGVVPASELPVYWSTDADDVPRYRRWKHDVRVVLGHRMAPAVTESPVCRTAARVGEAMAGYVADVCRPLDPTFTWLPGSDTSWYAGVAALLGERGYVYPIRAAGSFVDRVLTGERRSDELRLGIQADLSRLGLAPEAKRPARPRPTGERMPRPLWTRFDPTARMLLRAWNPSPDEEDEPTEVWGSELVEVARVRDEKWTHEVSLDDAVAVRDDLVAEYLGFLRRTRGVRWVHHEDRELVLVRAPRRSAGDLGERSARWLAERATATR
jgi:hypothetical protein